MNKQILTLVLGIFLLTSVSAIYGGETYSVEIDFEPVACSVTGNLTFDINIKDVSIDIPINFLGNFTLTCFSGEEGDPVIVYRGGGGSRKTIYKNVTQYEDKIVEVEKVIEVEVPGENNIIEKIIEVTSKRNSANIIIGVLVALLLLSLLWHYKKDDKIEETQNIVEKGGEN